MIRTVVLAWVVLSVPCSVLLGRMCRAGSIPLPPLAGRGGDPMTLAAMAATPAR